MGSLFGKKQPNPKFQSDLLPDEALLDKAQQYAKHGKPTLAVVSYRKYLSQKPNSPQIWEELAQVYDALGKPKDAEQARIRAASSVSSSEDEIG